MKAVLSLLFLSALATAYAGETYTTKYDNIDLDEILQNERLFKKYVDCLLNKGKCTPDGKELKEHLPEAIQTDCAKCSEKQKKGTEKVLKFMLANKKEDYAEIEKIYDPTGSYRAKYGSA